MIDIDNTDSKVKKDCFAYVSSDNSCEGLEHLYCKLGYCSFYKTQEQLDKQQEEADWRNAEVGIKRRK